MAAGRNCLLLILLLLPFTAAGQISVTTFGEGDGGARACYLAASDPLTLDLSACERALRSPPAALRDHLATRVNYAVILNRAGRPADALASLDQALGLDPRSGEAWVNRGNSLFLLGRAQESLADYQRALNLEVRRAHRVWYNIGLVHEQAGARELAIEAWSRSLAENPGFTLAEEKLRMAGQLPRPQ
ncbi:MAG: tetratricopeptide repeat protein [Chromatiales bacterium]|nr:tetratricopeptide repeat protein [Chromatiales bacterium]